VIAGLSNAAMATGIYPLVPHAAMAVSRWRKDREQPAGQVGVALREWAAAVGVSLARPCGFLPLPGARGAGPRPIIVVHGYAMNRANFLPLARRLAAAGLGPVLGFEYWTLGKTASAARKLAAYVDEVRAATGAADVDVIGHSMGGVVGRYFVQLGGGDGVVRNLVTIGSPHAGTDVSAIGIGRPTKELFFGSTLLERLRTAPLPRTTRMTVIWSRCDGLVPGARQARLPGADELVFDDLGHLSMLFSRRVADEIIARLAVPTSS
jgi:pimeloyl-ACP methyl ester carboxylesterase